MEGSTRRVMAFIVMVLFVMMMLVPAVSSRLDLATWLLTVLVAAVIVPLVLIYALYRSRKKVAEEGEQLTWRGLTSEEWKEERDPDDFEGEID